MYEWTPVTLSRNDKGSSVVLRNPVIQSGSQCDMIRSLSGEVIEGRGHYGTIRDFG